MTTYTTVQCGATRQNGEQCKRNTTKYADMCWQHTRMHLNVEIKKSKIPRTGQGLFATDNIPKGTDIVDYGGVIHTEDEWAKLPDDERTAYALKLHGPRVIDARDTQSGLGRWANDCRTANINANHCKGNNARFVRRTHSAKVRSTKRIRRGQEIYVGYGGRKYWR
jgi:SET domain-containing protein